MNQTLSQEQKKEIRRSILNSEFNLESTVRRLMNEGFSEALAQQLVVAEVQAFKKWIVEKAIRDKKEKETKGIALLVVMLCALFGGVFGVHSLMGVIAMTGIAGIAGFFGFRSKPLAGVLSAMTLAFIFPYTYTWYLSGRTTYINIELLIPMFIALAPAAIVYYLLAFTVYANTDEDDNY